MPWLRGEKKTKNNRKKKRWVEKRKYTDFSGFSNEKVETKQRTGRAMKLFLEEKFLVIRIRGEKKRTTEKVGWKKKKEKKKGVEPCLRGCHELNKSDAGGQF